MVQGDPDRIKLIHNTVKNRSSSPSPETLVLLDANSPSDGGCLRDAARIDDFEFTNLSDHGSCGPDEVEVFSVDDPVKVDLGTPTPGTIWTSASGETRTVDLSGPLRKLPLVIWVTQQLSNGTSVRSIARGDVLTANTIYNSERAGIRFSPVTMESAWKSPADVAAIGQGCPASVNTQVFQPGALNVYYVPTLGPSTIGEHCRTASWNMIYISIANRNDNTLAHEVGHALSLEHTGNAITSWYVDAATNQGLLEPSNLMWADSWLSEALSLGQAFRVNLELLSILNQPSATIAGARKCECRMWNGECDSRDGSENRRKFLEESGQDGVCPRLPRGWQ